MKCLFVLVILLACLISCEAEGQAERPHPHTCPGRYKASVHCERREFVQQEAPAGGGGLEALARAVSHVDHVASYDAIDVLTLRVLPRN